MRRDAIADLLLDLRAPAAPGRPAPCRILVVVADRAGLATAARRRWPDAAIFAEEAAGAVLA